MKIVIIGAGAMGSIYGCYLSKFNEVYMIDKNRNIVDHINENGITLIEDGNKYNYYPKAQINSENLGVADLVILFVKSLYSEIALNENKNIIGEKTILMTLQNGAGHEDILRNFTSLDKIVVGTTEDNGSVIDFGCVKHGGNRKTNIGMLIDDKYNILTLLKENFDKCGFNTFVHDNIQKLIWDKLLINISLSVVTGILQVKMGFIANNKYAWNMTYMLVKEAIAVAKTIGLDFNEEQVLGKIKQISLNNIDGCTSIYTDLKKNAKTEVDTISGAVLKLANKNNIEVPVHNFIINMVHAMENK